MSYFDVIPEEFFHGKKQPKVKTVGELITQLQRLPDKLRIQAGFGYGAKLTVYNIEEKSCSLEIEEIE